MKSVVPRRLALLIAVILIPGPLAAGQPDRSSQPTQPDKNEEWLARSERGEDWFFKEMPRHIKNDFVESFLTPATVWAFAAGLALTVGARGLDGQVEEGLEPDDSFGSANRVFDVMGNSLLLDGVTLAGLGVSKLAEASRPALTFGTMLEALLLTQALTYSIKLAGGRQRPDGSDDRSFPSGHTSSTFALAAVTQSFYGPLWGVPSFALASVIGFSRIDANEHFLSDVVFGALLGTLVGLGTARFHRREHPNLFIAPTAGNGSVGLTAIWRF